MKNLSRTTRLTLFATVMITIVTFIMQLFTIADTPSITPSTMILFVLPITALFSFVVSAIIIDRAMNPIRLMIERIRNMGDEIKPLVLQGEGEDIREYTIAFNHMAQQINHYIARQKQFISDASHELATPITVINGHADMLLRRGEVDPIKQTQSLTIIKNEALRMSELVNSLLLLARSDDGKQIYHCTPVNIANLLEEMIAETTLIAPNVIFENKTINSITAICDENAIRRVLRILLSNALKYSAFDNLHIVVEAVVSYGMVHVTVCDNGVGIPDECLPHIFERFYRVDPARTQKSNSSGLGLAIAHEIVTAHGGEIKAENVPTGGMVFRFSINTNPMQKSG